jgi:hypothetical protein
VRVAVGDLGIGVRASLSRRHNLGGMTDSEVLRFATQAGVTGSATGGGYGLATIVDAIQQNGRAVHLASGGGQHSFFRSRDSGDPSAVQIPGTIVEVAFDRPS